MKPDKVSPHDVFYQPARMVVPLFQRPYVWSKDRQWAPLWEDILRLTELVKRQRHDATHFLGAFVVQQVPGEFGQLPQWSVIDGQQRLTTLQVLLDALYTQLEGHGQTILAAQVKPLIENPPAFVKQPHDRYKVWPTNLDRPGFTAVMLRDEQSPTPVVTDSKFTEAHQFFSDRIAEYLGESSTPEHDASILVDAVSRRLEIVSIRLDADEDAQAIFETLNARGEPLSAADLIKNYVFQRLGGSEQDAEQAYVKHWAQFETAWWLSLTAAGRVVQPRSTWFLWHWLRAQLLEDFPIRELFSQFKQYTAERNITFDELLPRIHAAAERYRDTVEGSQAPGGVLNRTQWFSYRISTLDSDLIRPLLIWLEEDAQRAIPDPVRNRLLQILESWFVRRALVKANSNGSNRVVFSLLVALTRVAPDEVADRAEEFLKQQTIDSGYWPSDDEVRAALVGAPAYRRYSRSRLRMMLEAVEDHRRGFPDGNSMSMGPVPRGIGNIEHLMPQKWETHWPITGPDAEVLRLSSERNAKVQELGNLTLLTNKLNARISNSAWSDKQHHLRGSSDLLLTNEVLHNAPERWDETMITQRTARMIDEILNIWPAPTDLPKRTSPRPQERFASQFDIRLLSAEGLVAVGDVFHPKASEHRHIAAIINQRGYLQIGETEFQTPSGAGVHVYELVGRQRSIDGWRFWIRESDGRSLYSLRDQYVEQMEADPELDDDFEDDDE